MIKQTDPVDSEKAQRIISSHRFHKKEITFCLDRDGEARANEIKIVALAPFNRDC